MSNVQKVKQQFKPENKCRDCVFMKLELSPVETKTIFGFKKKSDKIIQILITLSFNQQEEKLSLGKIRFGIRRGSLSLQLENGLVPYEHRNFNDEFQTDFQITRQIKSSDKIKKLFNLLFGVKETKGQIGSEIEESSEETDSLKFDIHQISTKGSEDFPAWDFEVKTGEPYIKGTITKKELAKIDIQDIPCSINAIFTVSLGEIFIERVDGLWSKKIDRNQEIILDRLIILHLLKPKLQPYLSKHELKHE
ncbi:MAG: hypothetical protein ACRCU2_32475 [Planktothrix sp.]